ncbi:MAG TPA: hypothetical protein VF534_27265 [Paraburkholderia sp.]
MIECPDYGDVCLVPRGWYRLPESRQIVLHAREYGYEGDLMPVVLRGSRHARIHKYACHRDYGHAALMRYIRMSRATFVDVDEWQKFCTDRLFPMAHRQPWWNRQRSLWEIFFYMVNPWRVLIDGEITLITDKRQMANVRKIYSAMKKLEAA